jgi:NAD dependent epimerase/dehydratase family enzyme
MAEALLLASARVRPKVLERSGYQYRAPSLDEAIRSALEETS